MRNEPPRLFLNSSYLVHIMSILRLRNEKNVTISHCCHSITHSLFHSRLKKPSFSANPSHGSPSFLFLKYSLRGFRGLFTVISEHICFLLFVFFLFLHFLVVGSVRQIKLTHVGFRAHVKIASRIVSYYLSLFIAGCILHLLIWLIIFSS